MQKLEDVLKGARDYLMPEKAQDVEKFRSFLEQDENIQKVWDNKTELYDAQFCKSWNKAFEKIGHCYVFVDVNFRTRFHHAPEMSLLMLPLDNPNEEYVPVIKLVATASNRCIV